MEAGHPLRLAGQAGVAVEELQVRLGIEQALRLVLAVDAGDARRQVTEHREGHQGPVDRGPALSLGLDLAPQYGISVFRGQTVLLQEGRELQTLHHGLDDQLALARLQLQDLELQVLMHRMVAKSGTETVEQIRLHSRNDER